jgi:CIC family chloride channel protein
VQPPIQSFDGGEELTDSHEVHQYVDASPRCQAELDASGRSVGEFFGQDTPPSACRKAPGRGIALEFGGVSMSSEPHVGSRTRERQGNLLVLALLALLVGGAAGFLGAIFRLVLEQAERLRNGLIAWAHGHALGGFLALVIGCGSATCIAAWLVRRFSPHAAGSGIPHVEAVLHEQVPPASYGLAVVKFIGGTLAIGSGLALGREGPSVQMGASVANGVGRISGRGSPDRRVLMAAGAGAGLASAFNAPIAGAVFVLEELVQRFEARVAIAALAASTTAIAVARAILGNEPDFHVRPLVYPSGVIQVLFFALGAFAGLLAIAYNRTLLATAAAANRIARLPVEARGGLIGAGAGVLAWFAPHLVGGGDAITQRVLTGTDALSLIVVAFLIRFGLGAVSYAAATPGGLFAPLLVLGAQSGLLFGAACQTAFPGLVIQPEAFAVVGLAAFFTGVVRAPLTAIVLVVEMTANVTQLLPMLGACFVAMLIPTLLHDHPIYDSLREHTVRRERALQQKAASG